MALNGDIKMVEKDFLELSKYPEIDTAISKE
jgi:hypothetical protein